MKITNIKKTYLKYVSLNIIAIIGLSCYILSDTFFIAQGIGANGLTSLNLAIPVFSLIQGTGLMLGIGGATRFAISKSKTVFSKSLYISLIISSVFIIMSFFTDEIAYILGGNNETVQNTSIYLKTILCFAPVFLLENVVLCFVKNDGNPKLSMLAMLVASFSNIVLDYIFIFPLKMGMFGAAFATGIAPLIALFILSFHFIKKENSIHLLRTRVKISDIINIIPLGISSFITEISSGIVIIVFNIIILRTDGNLGVAAYGIIANISLVILSIFTGISQGMQPILSHCYSIKKSDDVTKTLKYGIITGFIIAVTVYILTSLFAEQIVLIFNKDSNIILSKIAVNGLRIYFTSLIFSSINIICTGFFSSVDKPKFSFLISVLRGFLIIIPAALILSFTFGINGVWIAVTGTEFIVFLISIFILVKNKTALLN